jgi:uncharacterized membrane protein (UPF0182 family)
MPQLKKVVLAMGNKLVYRDTYEEALAAITGTATPSASPVPEDTQATTVAASATPAPSQLPPSGAQLEGIRGHLRRYRELSAQGKWAEAGRELEALEKLVNSR